MKFEIHDYDKRLSSAISILKSSGLPENSIKLILDFADYSISEGKGKSRVTKCIQYLSNLSRWLGKDFPEANEEDIRKVVSQVNLSRYADSTKAEHKIILRMFYKWLRKAPEYPPEVKWLRPRAKMNSKIKMPEELLTQEEVSRMVRLIPNDRNKAFIACLYETGCRIGEILPIRIKHIAYDSNGAVISVDGKTGPRKVRIISSLPYLEVWLNKHFRSNDPESHVWIKTTGDLVKYGQILSILRDSARRAGIRKRVFPHLFRHSRATYLAKHLTEAQMKSYLGWVQGSEMAGIYVHMSGRDVDDALLAVAGVKKKPDKPVSKLIPRVCDRCGKQNPCTNIFCSRCGYILTEEDRVRFMNKKNRERDKADRLMDELIKDKEIRELLIRKLRNK